MRNLTKLKIIGYLYGVHFYLPIISLYFLGNGVTLQKIIISQALYSVVSFLGELPTGIFADKFGQKLSIIMGYLIETFGLLTMIFMPNELGLYVAYSIIGIAESFLSGSQEASIYESTKEEKDTSVYQKEYGAFLSNVTISFAVTTFIAGMIVGILGQSSYKLLITLTAFCLGLATLIATMLKDYKVKITDPIKSGQGIFGILGDSIHLMRTNKTIFTLITLTILTIAGEYFLYGVYQPYFEQAKVQPFFLGLVLSLGALLNYSFLKNSYRLEKYLPFEKITLFINIPLALSFILMAVIINPVFLVAAFILMKGLFETQTPIISDYVNEYTESHIRSTVLSGISLTKSFSNIIARIILAGIIGIAGVQVALFTQGAYLLIGTLIAYWVMVRCGCTYKISKHANQVESY